VLTHRLDRRAVAHLRGGDLELEWSSDNGHVYLTGPAVEVFSGQWNG
jgi:diaminopimelate epimerase